MGDTNDNINKQRCYHLDGIAISNYSTIDILICYHHDD